MKPPLFDVAPAPPSPPSPAASWETRIICRDRPRLLINMGQLSSPSRMTFRFRGPLRRNNKTRAAPPLPDLSPIFQRMMPARTHQYVTPPRIERASCGQNSTKSPTKNLPQNSPPPPFPFHQSNQREHHGRPSQQHTHTRDSGSLPLPRTPAPPPEISRQSSVRPARRCAVGCTREGENLDTANKSVSPNHDNSSG